MKDLDGFGVPVKWYVHRNDADMKNAEPLDAYGSKFGGVLSILYYVFLLGYFVQLLVNMYAGQNDVIKSQPMPNPFEEGLEKVNLTEN